MEKPKAKFGGAEEKSMQLEESTNAQVASNTI
jgi:hypothetical protein